MIDINGKRVPKDIDIQVTVAPTQFVETRYVVTIKLTAGEQTIEVVSWDAFHVERALKDGIVNGLTLLGRQLEDPSLNEEELASEET
jgi:hypothetical protein